jgi:hypothetical protein
MDHSECTHPRTPAGRSACRRGLRTGQPDATSQIAPKPAKQRRNGAVTVTRLPSVQDVLKGPDHVPMQVHTFLSDALQRGLRVQPHAVEEGMSFHVLSSIAAVTVTWKVTKVPKSRVMREEVSWFARRGNSSLARRIDFNEVWNALDVIPSKDRWL